jgi:hypothetical protein
MVYHTRPDRLKFRRRSSHLGGRIQTFQGTLESWRGVRVQRGRVALGCV